MKYIYVCGPTVYSDVHIGNIRPIMTFDIYNRALKELNLDFMFIHNITDIDDKIINRAQELNVSEKEISSKYEKLYLDLLKKANILTPSHLPKVTDNIQGIIRYIEKLISNGNAYESHGDVYFDISSINNYGKLSNRNTKEMLSEKNNNKKNPEDFALWKKTNIGITFDSPWSKGRPGWHTECAYFISDLANGNLDIHGGGIDLLFPHHENENAQNQAIYKNDIAKEWRHVGYINLDNQKMSKSLGNVILAKNFFKNYGPDILRYIFITTSYSAPINLSESLLKQSIEMINKLKKIFIKSQLKGAEKSDVKKEASLIASWKFAAFNKELNQAIKNFNKDDSKNNASKVFSLLSLIGFNFTKDKISKEDLKLYKNWVKEREDKNFEEADKLRKILITKNIL